MKRKNKSKSKPKLQQQSIINQKESLNNCSVCRLSIEINQSSLHCQRCNKFAHKSCYNFQENCRNKTFICDVCKIRKAGKDFICVECNTKHQGDMLKKLDNNKDSPQFIHVQCALISNFIQIQYSKMSFYRRAQKPRKSTRQIPQLLCAYCGKSNQCPIIQCIQCSELCHFRCLENREQNYYFFIYKWLDKCQKYGFLLQYIFSKKKTNIKNLIDHPVKRKNNHLELYLCKKHADDYTYCYCGKQQLRTQQNKSDNYFMCDFCCRWVHQICSGLPPDSINLQFKCEGCETNDIFKKQVKPNILFNQICLIQKSTGKLTQRSIRILNAFPFKYSLTLQNKINQSVKQIQSYFIKKQILKLAQETEQNDKKIKKIIQLLLVCAYEDRWKQFQTSLNRNKQKSEQIMSKIGDIKKFNFPQQIQESVKKLLNVKDKEQVKNEIKKQINKKEYVQKFKEQLRQFIKKWSSFQKKKLNVDNLSLAQQISKLYYQLLNFIQHIKEIKERQQFVKNFQKAFANTFFGQLITKKLTIQTIATLLKKYTFLQFYLSQKRDLSQQQYFQLLQGQTIYITHEQQQIYKEIIKKQVYKSNIKIAVECLKKQVLFQKFEKQLSQKNKDLKYLQQTQRQIIKKQVCILGAKKIFAINIKRIQNNVMKKKILKICNVQDHKIRQQNFSNINRIQQFLKRKKPYLTKSQIQCIQNYLGKLQLLLILLKKGQSMLYFMGEEQTNINLIEDEGCGILSAIFIKLFHILDNWYQKNIPPQFVINQMYNRCVLRKVKFTNSLITEKLKIFVTITTKKMENLLDEGRKINVPLLRSLVKVLNYFDIQKQFPNIQQLFQNVKKCSTILIGEDQFIHISELLEKPQKASNLLKIIQIKLNSFADLKNVHVFNQVNKLYLMRQWCRLTEKIQFLSKSKPTINGIQTFKTLLDRAAYPQNILSQHISQLQLESRTLNKYIIKYLQKPKAPEHLGFFEQIKFITNKMAVEQGYQIKQIFEKCRLDVYVQNQQLENQIKQFQQLPTNLIQQAEKRSLAELNIIRRKFIESSFKINKIEQYQYFLRKIYTLRCLNFEPPVTKQEYFQLLAIGGTAALYLQSKTSDLLRTYKALQKAQTQLCSQIGKKRNPNNLLPLNDQKYKEMKQDLRYDPYQLSKLQKARINNQKIRQQYMYLRTRKTDLDKYKQIQFQLSNSIFNNRDILTDISILKNDLNILVNRVQDAIHYSLPSPHLISLQNIFKREHGIFQAYNNIKIRHPSLQKFQHDYRYYIKAQQLRMQMSKQNYRAYCDVCSRVSEVGCKIADFLNSRTNQFLKMFQLVMSSDKPQQHMYQILITEGLQLRRLQSSQKQRIFTMVIQIYEKIRQLANSDEIQQDQISDQSQIQQSMNQQDLDQDQDDLEQDQDDQIDQSDDIQMDDFQDQESDESSSPKGNQGKDNHIILDSD